MTSYKRLFSFIVVSVITTIVSLVIAAVLSHHMPKVVSGETNHSIASEKEQLFSREQLKEAERNMEEQIRLLKEESRNKTLKEFLQEIKQHTIYVSWIPWFLIPFFLRINHWMWGLVLLSIPIVLVPTGLFLFVEILIFGSCLYLGNQFRSSRIGSDLPS